MAKGGYLCKTLIEARTAFFLIYFDVERRRRRMVWERSRDILASAISEKALRARAGIRSFSSFYKSWCILLVAIMRTCDSSERKKERPR